VPTRRAVQSACVARPLDFLPKKTNIYQNAHKKADNVSNKLHHVMPTGDDSSVQLDTNETYVNLTAIKSNVHNSAVT